MKNYDVKSSTIDFGNGKNVKVIGKRLAYLVPNMFNKITSGFSHKALAYLNSIPKPVSQVADDSAHVQAAVNAEPQVTKVDEKPTEPAKVEVETQKVEKNYFAKVLPMDIDFLRSKQLHIVSVPRRLLISMVFIQKLISHRASAINSTTPVVEEKVSPVIQTQVAVPEDPKTAGVIKYVELMSKRKEAILTKQACEKEMTELVNKFGITLDMVNAELAKGNTKIG